MAAAPQNPNQAIDAMAAVTTTHIVLMVTLAVAALAVIAWGIRQARRRRQAQARVEENFEQAEEHGATTDPAMPLPDEGAATISDDVPEAPAAPASGETAIADDLAQIKGLGPKLVALLADHGITCVAHLAALAPPEADALDAQLGPFQGRMARDRWIEQATLLSKGDRVGYEAAFGKLGG